MTEQTKAPKTQEAPETPETKAPETPETIAPEPKKKKTAKKKKQQPTIQEVDVSDIDDLDLSSLKKKELLVVAEKLKSETERKEQQAQVMAVHGPLITNVAHQYAFQFASEFAREKGWDVPTWDRIEPQEQHQLNTALIEVLEAYLPNIETSPLMAYGGVLALTLMKHSKRIEQTDEQDKPAGLRARETRDGQNNSAQATSGSGVVGNGLSATA